MDLIQESIQQCRCTVASNHTVLMSITELGDNEGSCYFPVILKWPRSIQPFATPTITSRGVIKPSCTKLLKELFKKVLFWWFAASLLLTPAQCARESMSRWR